MANVGFATLQIIPSALGFQKRLNAQVAGGMAASGVTAGKTMGAGVGTGVAASSGIISKGAKVATKGGLAAIAALGYGVLNAGGDFQAGMNQVRAVSGATGKDFRSLRDQAKQLGSSTKFSAGQAAEGMGFLAMAGFQTKDILGAMPDVLNLAAAANLDLGRSADITSNILTGYGLKTKELGRANDVLVKAFTSTNTDLSMLGESFKYVGPVAKSAGVEFEEAAAAIGLMGNAGIQGSMAGTGLRSAITSLLNPTAKSAALMKELGFNALDAEGDLLPLHQIIGRLEKSGAKTGDVMALFGQRAGPAMQSLLDQGSGAIKKQTALLKDSGGIADKVAKTQMEGLKGATTTVKSAFEGLFITLGDKGPLQGATALMKGLGTGVQRLTGFLEGGSGAGSKFAGVFASVKEFAAPLWEVLKGIGADIRAVVSPAISEIGGLIRGSLLPAFQAFLPAVQPIAKFLLKVLGSAVVGVLKGVVNVVKGVLKTISGLFNVFAGLLTGDWSRLWKGVRQIVSGVFSAIVGAVQVFWNGSILAIFKKGAAFLLKGIWTKLWSGVKGLAKSGMSAARSVISSALSAIRNVFSSALSSIVNFVRSRFATAKSIVSSSMAFARSKVSGAFTAIRSLVSNAVSGVVSRIRSGFSNAVSAIRNAIGTAVDVVRGLPGRALSALGNIGSRLYSAGANLIRGFIDGVKSVAGNLIAAVTAPVQGAISKAKGLLGINSPSRVFMEIGGYTAEGMALGIEKGAGRVSKAAAALGSVRPSTAGVATAAAGAPASAAGGSSAAEALLEAVEGLRDDIRRLPKDYRLGDRRNRK